MQCKFLALRVERHRRGEGGRGGVCTVLRIGRAFSERSLRTMHSVVCTHQAQEQELRKAASQFSGQPVSWVGARAVIVTMTVEAP
jgi:hypothetical protein